MVGLLLLADPRGKGGGELVVRMGWEDEGIGDKGGPCSCIVGLGGSREGTKPILGGSSGSGFCLRKAL